MTPEELEGSLAPEDRAFLDALAEGLARRRLASAAIFFLESSAPLNWVASQGMHFFRPIVQTFSADPVTWDRVARLLEQRGMVELLVRRLEARA
jgi:hypothetical protein